MHLRFGLSYSNVGHDRLTYTGSDLHMYEGRTAAEAGLVFGHENMGVIVETGPGVTLLKKGDRVVMPFNVADGRCRNCEEGKTAFCTGVNVSGSNCRDPCEIGSNSSETAWIRWRCLWLCGDGTVPRRTSTVHQSAIRGFQWLETSSGNRA